MLTSSAATVAEVAPDAAADVAASAPSWPLLVVLTIAVLLAWRPRQEG